MPLPESSVCSPLAAAVAQEAVRRLESQGPLHDADELAQAVASAQGYPAQMRMRAWLLAQRLGWGAEWQRGRVAAAWAVCLLAALMAASGLLLGRAVLGEERTINAVAAWLGLLGAHAVSLLLWLLALCWPGAAQTSTALGRAALWLGDRLAGRSGQGRAHTALLAQSFWSVVRRQRLLGALSGAISHSVWALALLMAWAALAFGFAFRAYTLTWESTLFSPAFLQDFVRVTGALPAAVGFAVPEVSALGAEPGQAQPLTNARAWAWWLLGSLLVYGLLPRLLLAAGCWWAWRRGLRQLAQPTLDEADPATRRVLARLQATQAPGRVIDPERPTAAPTAAPGLPAPPAQGWALLGLELPPEAACPPPGLPAADWVARLDGSPQAARAALQRLAQQPLAALLLQVHPPASPDRALAQFLSQAAPHARCCAVLLHAAQPEDLRRWQSWLQAQPQPLLALTSTAQAAQCLADKQALPASS